MSRILIADTYYPDFLKSLPHRDDDYAEALRFVLDQKFGTFDAYSSNLRKLGHECMDVIVNDGHLQCLWARQYWNECQTKLAVFGNAFMSEQEILTAQMDLFRPEILFLQDLNILVKFNKWSPAVIAGQCSCPWPGDDAIKRLNIVFTSFPHYVDRIQALGVRAVYLPLAFEPSVLNDPMDPTLLNLRDIDIAFVGGVGRNSHWRVGTDLLELFAETFGQRFHWYGYGVDNLDKISALRTCHRGMAWGREMYSIYRRAKIVINRHGEVAQGFANNLRMYEATGCGAMLLTEAAPNLNNLFGKYEVVSYSTMQQAVVLARYFLNSNNDRMTIAANGQRRTWREHTYADRMKVVDGTLKEFLCPA